MQKQSIFLPGNSRVEYRLFWRNTYTMSLNTFKGSNTEVMEEQISKIEIDETDSYEVIQDDFKKFGGFVSVDEVIEVALPGDLIEFYRLGYHHYALYLGAGKVMNIVAKLYSTKALICEMMLEDVVKASGVRICNHDDVAREMFDAEVKPFSEMLENARSFENQEVPYELTLRNCEYYTTLWRYGVGFSTQVLVTERTQGAATALEALRSIPDMFPDSIQDTIQSGVSWIEEKLTTERETEKYEKYKELARKVVAMKNIKDSLAQVLKPETNQYL